MMNILIIDDQEGICWALERLMSEMGHSATSSATAAKGLAIIKQQPPDLLFLDIRLPDMNGLDALCEVRKIAPQLPVVVITAYGTITTAVRALKEGAVEYLTKPLDLYATRRLIKNILSPEGESIATADTDLPEGASPLIGKSRLMQEVYKRIAAIAQADATVLIEGESGTGKELVARAVHLNSARRDAPFVAVACAALPETLLESELFGHAKGAFTGALTDKPGKFLKADSGVLFLDEISALSPRAQVKLLRFLQEREFEPVGSNELVKVDVRIIAATNLSLQAEVARENFREDLYYRLNVVNVQLPPLRQRKEDIPLLVAHFLHQFGSPQRAITEDAMQALMLCDWEGNVRELENAIEHALVLSRGQPLRLEYLPESVRRSTAGEDEPQPERGAREAAIAVETLLSQIPDNEKGAYNRIITLFEKSLIEMALARFGNNQVITARFLGISRSTLRKKIATYNITVSGDNS